MVTRIATVQSGQPIKAANYNELVEVANSTQDLNQRTPLPQRLNPAVIHVRNCTEQVTYATGTVLSLQGWGNQQNGRLQREQTQTQGIWLNGHMPESLQRYYPYATAITLEMIGPQKYGLAYCPSGVIAAGVIGGQPYQLQASYARVITSDELPDQDVTQHAGLTLSPFGEYLIIAYSAGGWRGNEPSDMAWCACVPVCDYGHFTGILKTDFTQNAQRTNSAEVSLIDKTDCNVNDNGAIARVYCPILPPGATINAGTIVFFQRNNINGLWEIFATECPT